MTKGKKLDRGLAPPSTRTLLRLYFKGCLVLILFIAFWYCVWCYIDYVDPDIGFWGPSRTRKAFGIEF